MSKPEKRLCSPILEFEVLTIIKHKPTKQIIENKPLTLSDLQNLSDEKRIFFLVIPMPEAPFEISYYLGVKKLDNNCWETLAEVNRPWVDQGLKDLFSDLSNELARRCRQGLSFDLTSKVRLQFFSSKQVYFNDATWEDIPWDQFTFEKALELPKIKPQIECQFILGQKKDTPRLKYTIQVIDGQKVGQFELLE